jgi:hypothetical protein
MVRSKAMKHGSSILHTMRRAHEYKKYSKTFRRRIVCCMAQQDFLWLVCTCGASMSVVHKANRQGQWFPQSCLCSSAANAW